MTRQCEQGNGCRRGEFSSCIQGTSELALIPPRDIYYIDPAYFRSQDTVDTVIDELAYTIGVDRGALNVVSLDHDVRARTMKALAEDIYHHDRKPQGKA